MNTVDTIVIGAGLSGLVAAHALHRANRSVLVLESGERAGGLIQTLQADGFTLEAGPNTFPSTATELLSLCAWLNLAPKAAHSHARKRYVYLNQTLTALPQQPLEALGTPLLSPGGKWRLLQEPLQPKTTVADCSVADFLTRRVGREIMENLVDPFVSGIYAGDVAKLSLPAVFPKLWQWEQTGGSLLKGALAARRANSNRSKRTPMQLLSFEDGLTTLTQALEAALPTDAVRFHQRVAHIQLNDHLYHIRTQTGETYAGRHLILAVPAYVSASLLQTVLPQAANALAEIPYNGLAVVHTGFSKTAIPHPLDGFGCLIPRREKLPLLGSIWASSLFPERAPEGHIVLSNFIGGAHQPEIATWPEERIAQLVLENLQQLFKTTTPLQPSFQRVLTYSKAIPQYNLGHLDRIQRLENALSTHPTLQLCGNYLHGVALNECVKSGLSAATRIMSLQ